MLMTFEDMDLVAALYVMVQIITTVGYGDLTVASSDPMKLFMSFYVLFCLLFVAGAVSTVVEQVIQTGDSALREKMQTLTVGEQNAQETKPRQGSRKFTDVDLMKGVSVSGKSSPGKKLRPKERFMRMISKSQRKRNRVAKAAMTFAVILVIGVIFFAVEGCSCSYGISAIDGCDPENCSETGATMSLIDAFYMACITVTTVGFGDKSAKSFKGRIFACAWMLVSVVATTNFVLVFTEVIISRRKKLKHIDRELFDQIDVDKSGYLSRYEFSTFVLQKFDILNAEDLRDINYQFDFLDKDDSGEVSFEEIEELFQDPEAVEQSLVSDGVNAFLGVLTNSLDQIQEVGENAGGTVYGVLPTSRTREPTSPKTQDEEEDDEPSPVNLATAKFGRSGEFD